MQATCRFIAAFTLLIICYFGGCKPSTADPTSTDATAFALSADHLLRTADSIPTEEMLARANQLPDNFKDSFFTKRLQELEKVENDNEIKKTLQLYKQARPDFLLPESLEHYYQGIFYQYAAKFDSAEVQYALATKGFEQLGATYYLAQTLDKHSGNLNTKGRSDEALAMKYRALELLKKAGYKEDLMKVQIHLANVLNIKGDFEQAIATMEAPIAYYETQKDSTNLAYTLSIKGNALLSQKDFPNALLYHQKALAMRRQIKAVSGITESLFHVGRTFGKLNQWQAALDTFRVAAREIEKSTDKQGQAYIEAGIGEALFNLGRYEEAEKYLLAGLDLSVKRRQYPAALLAASRLSTARKAQKRFAEALQYHEQYVMFKDSVFSQEKDKLSRELRVKYETQEKELEIAALQRENKLNTERNWLVGSALILIAAIGFYAFSAHTARERQRLEHEALKAENQAQLLAKQLQIQNIELDANQTRLNDYAQMLIERNQQLNSLALQLEIKSTPSQSEGPDSFGNLYNQVILTEADWEKFQDYFNRVYPGFIAKLRTQYTELTPAEIRLVLLNKLGLSLKESSAILGISIDAVKKGRYRLKKKYNLETDDLSSMI